LLVLLLVIFLKIIFLIFVYIESFLVLLSYFKYILLSILLEANIFLLLFNSFALVFLFFSKNIFCKLKTLRTFSINKFFFVDFDISILLNKIIWINISRFAK